MRIEKYDLAKFSAILDASLSSKRITQKEMAKQLNVSQVAIHNWIYGVNKPSNEKVEKACEILDINIEHLLTSSHYENILRIFSDKPEKIAVIDEIISKIIDLPDEKIHQINDLLHKERN